MAGPGTEPKGPGARTGGLHGERYWRSPSPPVPLGPLSDALDHGGALVDARLRSANAELERSAERARKLHAVTVALLGSLTPAQVAEIAVNEGAGVVGASGGVLLTIAADNRLEVAGAVHCPPELLDWVQSRTTENAGPFITPLHTGEPGWMGGLPFLARRQGSPEAWALLPLSVRDRVSGMLLLRFEGRTAIPDEYRWFLILLAQQCAQALERARLYDAERNARVEAQFAERQISFLAAVSTRLAETLTEQESLAAAAQLAALNLGDFCAIHVAEEDGAPRLAVAMWNDHGEVKPYRPAGGSLPIDPSADLCYAHVIATGEPELVPEVDDAMLVRLAGDEGRLEQLRQIGPTSYFCVPVCVRDAVVGTLTIASRRPGRHFSASDLAIGEELASRMARAIETARLYQSTLSASRAKSNFLAVMSHELRTPLNAILGYADLALMDVPATIPVEAKSHMERIRAAAKHLLRLVDDVLSFSRADAGQDRLQIEPVRLDVAVGDAVALIRPAADGKGLAVKVQAQDNAVIETDGGRLSQILNNLLTNAVKFTAEGELDVDARIDGDQAVIRVTDTGIGIAAEYHGRIFDPFWQVDQGHARQFGGTGIGLGVARHLARVLGGRVDVQSQLGAGSTFVLRIPTDLATLHDDSARTA
ncbi:MAG: ATP-binding protein [Longimicrobiales bacterium]